MNSAVLKSMKGTSAPSVIHGKIPPTSPSQNSLFCCQCYCLIPEGINEPSLKMNAVSDGETEFQGGCTGSLAYCCVLFSILITPFTADPFRLESHTHAVLLPTGLTEIQTVLRCTGPIRSCTKEKQTDDEKCVIRKGCEAFHKAREAF